MSSGKAQRVGEKVIWVREREKVAFRLFISKHHSETGVQLKEWQAMEIIMKQCLPDLLKEADRLQGGNGEKKRKE